MSDLAYLGRNRRMATRIALEELPNGTEEEIVEFAASVQAELNRDYIAEQNRKKTRQSTLVQGGMSRVGALPGPLNVGSAPFFANQAQDIADATDFLPAAGGVAGAFGGGGLTGSMLGAFGGGVVDSLADQFANRATEETFGFPGKNDVGQGPLREGRNEAMTEYLGSKVFEKTIGAGAGLIRGTKSVADDVIRNMEALGIAPSLQDISDTGLVEGARRVFGSFPLLAKPFAKRQRQVTDAIRNRANKMVEDVFPDVLVLRDYAEKHGIEKVAEISEALNNRAFKGLDRAYKEFGKRQEKVWGEVQSIAYRLQFSGRLPAQSPTILRARGQQALKRFSEFPAGAADDATSLTSDAAKAQAWIRGRLEAMPEAMNFEQLRKAKRAVQQQINAVEDGTEEFAALVLFKEGVEEQMRHAAKQSPELWEAYQRANAVSEEFLTLIDDMAARRFRRLNRLVGRREADVVDTAAGQATKQSPTSDFSQTLEEISKAGNPKEVRQFYGVMRESLGEREAQKVIGATLAKRLDEGFSAALKESTEKSGDDLFKTGVLLKKLGLEGLVNPRSAADAKSLAMVEMMKASGMKPQRIVQLSKTIDAIFSVKNPNVAEFIRRRAILGGAASLLSGVTGGVIAGKTGNDPTVGAMLGPVAFVLMGRGVGKLFTSPRAARWMISAADSASPLHARGRAMASLLTDPSYFSTDQDPELAEIQRQALEKLKTRKGREEFFRQIDETFDIPKLR